jgi:hypothetical protein
VLVLRNSRCHGNCGPGTGFTDLKATEQLAAETERKVSRMKAGLIDPNEEHVRRPLVDHLTD